MARGRHGVAYVLVPVAAALALLVALWPPTNVARACSGPPYDVNKADVIAEGWIDRVELGPAPPGAGQFQPVQVTMRVVRSLKGDAPSPLTFTDASSYLPDPSGGPQGFWAGSSGGCGILDDDPTGQYALIVFERRNGELATHLLLGAVFRDGPDDPTIARFRNYLEDRLVPGSAPRVIPTQGVWGAALASERWPFALAGAVLVVAFTTLAALWVRSRWRNA